MEPNSRASFGSSAGGSMDFESDLTLSDRLKAFKSSAFDPSAYFTTKCQTMNEKEIRHLCSYLVELKKASAEEMRKNVYANYASFIRTSKEISDLEGELLSMRNLLSTQATLVHHLADGILVDSLATGQDDPTEDDLFDNENTEQSKIDSWLSQFLDTLEVLLAEKRVDDALAALDEGEKVAEEASETNKLGPNTLISLQTAITEQRQKLADQLAETTCHTQGAELRSAILALKKLGDGPRAHTLLLNSHHQKLQHNMRSLRSSHTSYGGAYATALSQFVFSTIAQAANDSLAVFGEETAFASELVTWAVKQTESFSILLKRHVIASSALAGGLRVAADCLQMCLGHCSLLEARGLALSPVILRHFRPTIQQALNNSLKRIEQSSAAVAAADDWLLNYLPGGMRHTSSTTTFSAIGNQPKLSRSAHRFNSLIQEFVEDVWPIESLQLQFDGSILDGIWQVFDSYVNLLVSALPGSVETEDNLGGSANKIVRMAATETQQIALLANASLLADELLPRGATKLLPLQQSNRVDMTPRRATERQNRNPEQREWKRRLQRSTERLRDSFCRTHALELIFTEEGDARLNGQMYTYMDGNAEEPEWFPSPIFQELFAKLTRVASIASDMFVGRERFATLLLMRLTETVILWLSNDQSFWEEIEGGPQPLGPLGLQQFYLDMEFVILFASQGRYLSRNLHQVIKNIIARAIEAIQATGIDPYSVLPEDDWFAEVAQIAIKMLSGKGNFGSVSSPTASVSGKSMSSPISHGSNHE